MIFQSGRTVILTSTLNVVLPFLYAILVWFYGKAFFADAVWAKNIKTKFLVGIVALHLLYLIARAVAFRHPPVTTIFEILSVLAFSIAVTYLTIELLAKVKGTGYFILNIAFFFQLGSSLFIKDVSEVPEVLRSNLFGLHVSSALLGYAAITIAAAYGFLYLMLYHEIKATRFGVIYKKLPTLETLEKMSTTAISLSFVLLGVAMLFGFVWLPQAFVSFSYSDPKLVGTLIVWILYGVLIVARKSNGWKGRKVMILSIFGFAFTIFSMTIINIFFSGFHKFY